MLSLLNLSAVLMLTLAVFKPYIHEHGINQNQQKYYNHTDTSRRLCYLDVGGMLPHAELSHMINF